MMLSPDSNEANTQRQDQFLHALYPGFISYAYWGFSLLDEWINRHFVPSVLNPFNAKSRASFLMTPVFESRWVLQV
jgi:hypothetical protein